MKNRIKSLNEELGKVLIENEVGEEAPMDKLELAKQEIFNTIKYYEEEADKARERDNHDGVVGCNGVVDGLRRALEILKNV